jgi:hypothetical protein
MVLFSGDNAVDGRHSIEFYATLTRCQEVPDLRVAVRERVEDPAAAREEALGSI